MNATRNPDGTITIPKRAEDENNGVVGDGFVNIKPGDDGFSQWDEWLKSIGQ
jgi:hypothetical protein